MPISLYELENLICVPIILSVLENEAENSTRIHIHK
jgi:hypothetical protein